MNKGTQEVKIPLKVLIETIMEKGETAYLYKIRRPIEKELDNINWKKVVEIVERV